MERKRIKLAAELTQSYELFLKDKNSSFNNPLKEKTLSHQHVWEKVGAELPPSIRVPPQREEDLADAAH